MNRTDVFVRLFVNRLDCYFEQYRTADGVGYACLKSGDERFLSITEAVARHFNGQLTLSLPAVSTDAMSKWCCFDSDDDRGELERVESLLLEFGFNPLRESKRTGRAGHSWLIFDAPVLALSLIRFGREILLHAGAEHIEFFPKTATGHSQVRAPFGIHKKPSANNVRGWFDGAEQDINLQLGWLDAQPRSSAAAVNRIASALSIRDQQLKPKPRTYGTAYGGIRANSDFKILQFVDARRNSKGYSAPCPLCRAEAHDRHGDNLQINADGSIFTCVFGGPGRVHRACDIRLFLQAGGMS